LADGAAAYDEILQIATAFLEENGFATLHVHLSLNLDPSDTNRWLVWERLTAYAKPFQVRARDHLTEARLHIAPIIVPSGAATTADAIKTAEFFTARLALPSFYLPGEPLSELPAQMKAGDARFFIDSSEAGLTQQLYAGHVLETVLERVAEGSQSLLDPCRPHLVLDEQDGLLIPCLRQWREIGAQSAPSSADQSVELPTLTSDAHCAQCIADCAASMQGNLRANRREKEGREVYFKLALALAARQHHGAAAALAHHAYELSTADQDRVAALIHESSCLRDMREFESAEQVLELAGKHTADDGLIAYHRGRVQFEWRDYIEALDRFEEALESGSPNVPLEDTCFEMALCHINIEEYQEARPYLDRSLEPGEQKAPVCFYRGVCDFAEGQRKTALEHFTKALDLGPSAEDLGRVLFYIGACHKELRQFDQAIEYLRRAVAADPEDIANHNLLGFCYYSLKRHEEAVACFRRAVELDPKSGIDWANLGSNLRDLGRTDEAIEMYRKALSLDPHIGFARDALAKLTAT
jgi:tetratricopeptide (TPR) repeat protein